MLILTRKLDEAICIADDITIEVVGLSGTQVKLGISAPKHISILREELLEPSAADDSVLIKIDDFGY